MKGLPIMDAGPGLNFFSLHRERMLFQALGPLCVPETVHAEMIRKAHNDQRFAGTQKVLGKLPSALLEVLSDDATGALRESFECLAQMPMAARLKNGKDLGELMVVAHAAAQAEQGHDITVLIDDQGGQRLATLESSRLDRRRAGTPNTGHLRLITTQTVLERSIAGQYLPDPAALRMLYARMRQLDDGLLPLERTGLLSSPRWLNSH